jgi:hypothetical protein
MWTLVFYKYGFELREKFKTADEALFYAKRIDGQQCYELAKKCLYDPDGNLVANDEIVKMWLCDVSECVMCETLINLEQDNFVSGVSLGEHWCKSCSDNQELQEDDF